MHYNINRASVVTHRKALLWLIAGSTIVILCILTGPTGFGWPDLSHPVERAILGMRLTRLLCAFMVGAALAGAGVILQAVLRNPLAEPYVLGVSSGAGLGAAVAILAGLTTVSVFALPLCAFAAGSLTLLLVYMLARQNGTMNLYGLILSGVIVSSVGSSLLMFLVATAPVDGMHSILWWMLGNLHPSSRELLLVSSALLLAIMAATWFLATPLNALALGSETAHHLGIRLNIAIPLALAAATSMTAVAVSLSGLIGFVGLIVPHVARRVFGADHRRLLPAAALLGGVFLAACDAIARTLLAPEELPVGVITALCGGPFFLYLLRRKSRHGWAP